MKIVYGAVVAIIMFAVELKLLKRSSRELSCALYESMVVLLRLDITTTFWQHVPRVTANTGMVTLKKVVFFSLDSMLSFIKAIKCYLEY